jgi:hypothetical protein
MSSEWLSAEEAWEQLQIPPEVLLALYSVESLILGRAVRSRMQDGVRIYSRADLIRAAAETRPTHGRLRATDRLVKHDRVEDPTGVHWCGCRWAMAKLNVSRTRLLGWHESPTPYLRGGTLRAEKTYIKLDGRWKHMWLFYEGDLGAILTVKKAGKIVDPVQGPGLGFAECAALGFTKRMLLAWSTPLEEGGRGIPEFPGEVLDKWEEYRVKGDGALAVASVFSQSQLLRVRERRAARSLPTVPKTELTDSEAIQQFPNLKHKNNLAYWRNVYSPQLGRRLNSSRAGRCVLNDLADLKDISKKLEEEQAKEWTDAETGEQFLPTWVVVADYAIPAPTLYTHINQRTIYLKGGYFHPKRFDRPRRGGRWNKQPLGWPKKEVLEYVASRARAKEAARKAKDPESAAAFLARLLANGEMRSSDVRRLFLGNGFSAQVLRPARVVAGVKNDRAVRRNGPRLWYLEGTDPSNIQVPPAAQPVSSAASATRQIQGQTGEGDVAQISSSLQDQPATYGGVEVTNPEARPVPIAGKVGLDNETREWLDAKLRDRSSNAATSWDRLCIDAASGTVILDGTTHRNVHPDGAQILAALLKAAKAGKPVVSSARLMQQTGCSHENTLRRWIEQMPKPLQELIKSKRGSGRWLELPQL